MWKSSALLFLAFAAAALIPAARPDREAAGPSHGFRVRADRTLVRTLENGSIQKEYAGNVKIWNRALSLKSMRAVWRSDSGVVRLYGGPKRGKSRSPRGSADTTVRCGLLDSRGKTIVAAEAGNAALYGRNGVADSIHASGTVTVRWIPRKAKAEMQHLRWIARTRDIYGDSTVVLTMSGMVERGNAFHAGDDLAWYTLRNVTGTIHQPGAGKRKDTQR
jgi:hypothetical protein